MEPIDYRNATFHDIQERLTRLRLAALKAWRMHGPGTTREVARRAGMDLLTFRPRTTELYQLGLVMLVERSGFAPGSADGRGGAKGGEGIYAGLMDEEAREVFAARKARALGVGVQPELKLA